MESETVISTILLFLLFFAGFGTYHVFAMTIWHQTIASQGFLTYSGNAEIMDITIINTSALRLTFNILKEGNYILQLTINQKNYEEQVSWNIGIETLLFNVTFPESPFEIAIKVLET
jgi:hypothetical protein